MQGEAQSQVASGRFARIVLSAGDQRGVGEVEGDAKAALEAQAPKRAAIHFKPLRTATWDHRKLGGSY